MQLSFWVLAFNFLQKNLSNTEELFRDRLQFQGGEFLEEGQPSVGVPLIAAPQVTSPYGGFLKLGYPLSAGWILLGTIPSINGWWLGVPLFLGNHPIRTSRNWTCLSCPLYDGFSIFVNATCRCLLLEDLVHMFFKSFSSLESVLHHSLPRAHQVTDFVNCCNGIWNMEEARKPKVSSSSCSAGLIRGECCSVSFSCAITFHDLQAHTTRKYKESETRKVKLCWWFWFAVTSGRVSTRNPTNLPVWKKLKFLCQESAHVLSAHKHQCDCSEEGANTQQHEPDLLRRSRTAPDSETKWFGLVGRGWKLWNWRCQDSKTKSFQSTTQEPQMNQNFHHFTWHFQPRVKFLLWKAVVLQPTFHHESHQLLPRDPAMTAGCAGTRQYIDQSNHQTWRVPIHRGTPSHPFLDGIFPNKNPSILGYHHDFGNLHIKIYWNTWWDMRFFHGLSQTFFGPQMRDLKCQEKTNQQQHALWLLCIEESLEIHLEGGPLQCVLSRAENEAPWDDTSSSLAQNLQNRLHVHA